MKETTDLICPECGSGRVENYRDIEKYKSVITCAHCKAKYIYLEEIDTDYTREAVCPYCGWENSDSWELRLDGDGDSTTIKCGECEKEFKVYLNLEVTYSTEKIEEK